MILDHKILRTVKEHNERNEPIFVRRLTELHKKDAAYTTVHNHARDLVSDGKLRDETITENGRIHKYLFITELGEDILMGRPPMSVKRMRILKILPNTNLEIPRTPKTRHLIQMVRQTVVNKREINSVKSHVSMIGNAE